MSRWACGLHSMRECFSGIQNEKLDSVLFFTAFLSHGHLSKMCFFPRFPVFLWILCLGEHVACICSMSAFFRHSKRKSWFRIVFHRFFEPWTPLKKVCFLDFFQLFRTQAPGSLSQGTNQTTAERRRLARSARVLFSGTQNEKLDSVLFFTAFLSRGHL